MKSILSVLVENRAGVLSRTAGLFARRGYNIENLAVGETEDPTISRMTIVASGDAHELEQISKQLNKQVDVIKVRHLDETMATRRELALIKIKATPKGRSEIIDIASIMKSEIVDISAGTLTVEICDRPERVARLVQLLEPYGILELARTGMVALSKEGSK